MENSRVDLQARKNEIERQIESLEAEIATNQLEQENTPSKLKREELEVKENECRNELLMLQQEILNIGAELNKLKRFNRELCLNNIDYLLAQKNIKLGALETDSGNRPGYLSRMKSGKSTSDPSIEFLMTASEQLEIPLDMLISSKISEVTPTEQFILDFLNKIMKDTKEDKLSWVRESVAELEKLEVDHDGNGYPYVSHPLYEPHEDRLEDDYNVYPIYDSLFFRNCGVKPCSNCYHVQLVPTDQWLYIMECEKGDKRIEWKEARFFEFYLVDYDRYGNGTKKRICNTLDVSSPIKAVINSLIKLIIVSLSHVHIDNSVKAAISAYMQGIAPPPEVEELPFN